MLASLPPITGLYVALIPVFVYVAMGTSKHLSVGEYITYYRGAGRSIVEGAHIHIFVFTDCENNRPFR